MVLSTSPVVEEEWTVLLMSEKGLWAQDRGGCSSGVPLGRQTGIFSVGHITGSASERPMDPQKDTRKCQQEESPLDFGQTKKNAMASAT